MRPLVAITPRLRGGRLELPVAYAAALEEAGLAVVLAAPVGDAAALAARIDGLLIPGGPDFLPPRPYPEPVEFDAVSADQLAFDSKALAAALARGLPVLGICYGMQLLALELGGSLHHHLPLDLPGAAVHKPPSGGDASHGLRVQSGTRLSALLGSSAAVVNSRHHQAVSDPGPRLHVAARADDGVIEAVEGQGGSFCLGVQWHPETLGDAHRKALFGAFAAACRSRAPR